MFSKLSIFIRSKYEPSINFFQPIYSYFIIKLETLVSAWKNSSNAVLIITSRIFYSLKTIINQNRWVAICRTLLCERIDPRLSTNEDCFCWCYSIFSFQKRTTNYSLYRPLVQPPYLFLNHNNGFPIRLRFSLASNHCPDLARDYSIRFSSRGYDSTRKVDRFAFLSQFFLFNHYIRMPENSSHSR